MGSYARPVIDGFFCSVVSYEGLLTVFQNVILHYKWNPSEAREMHVDDFDDEGLLFWHIPIEKLDKEYKKMLNKKK